MNKLTEELLEEYSTGKYTIKDLSKRHGISVGKIYYILRDAECLFSRKRRKPVSQEERDRRSKAAKGKHPMTEERKNIIREANSCHFNGFNGYGHSKIDDSGYVIVYAPEHPNAHADGYVLLHRLLMERKLNRYLGQDEVVHHINHKRTDNRIENLRVMTKKEHMSMHMKERHEQRRRLLSIG